MFTDAGERTGRTWQGDRPINSQASPVNLQVSTDSWRSLGSALIPQTISKSWTWSSPQNSSEFHVYENSIRIQWVTYWTRSKNIQMYYSSLILVWVGDLNHFCCHFSTHKIGIIVTYLFEEVFWNLWVKSTMKQLNFIIRCYYSLSSIWQK